MSAETVDFDIGQETAGVDAESSNTKMPSAIAAAVVAVMSKVRVLQKDARNDHGRYDFASADKFFEVVGGACSEAGLFILQDEAGLEIVPNNDPKKNSWLRLQYQFTLVHSSGEMYENPLKRTVMVPATGGQSFGAAQSYTMKQFERSLFQIATGDKDEVDLGGETSIDPQKMSPTARKKAGFWRGPLQVTALKTKMRELHKALDDCETPDQAQKAIEKFDEVLEQCKVDLPEWYGGSHDQDSVVVRIREHLPDYDLPEGYKYIDRFGQHVVTYRDPLQYVQAIYAEADSISIPEAMISLYEHNEGDIEAASNNLSDEDKEQYCQRLVEGYKNSQKAVEKKTAEDAE